MQNSDISTLRTNHRRLSPLFEKLMDELQAQPDSVKPLDRNVAT